MSDLLHITKERGSELGDTAIEIIQNKTETQRGKKSKEKINSTSLCCVTISNNLI